MRKSIKQYWKVLVWSAVIFALSSIPTLPKSQIIWWDFILKKTAHVVEYTVLFILTYKTMEKKGNFMTPILFTLAFALSDEYHQSFVLGRSARFQDIGFDSIGILLAYLRLKR